MADTVEIFGKHVKKSTAIIAGGGAAVVIVYAIIKKRNSSAAAAAAAAAPAAASSTDNSNIDPATGLPAGSPEDLTALAAQQGGYGAYGQYGAYGGGNTAPNSTPPTGAGFTSNPQWSQAAEQYITGGTGGGGPADVVGNALGKYLTGGELTPDQAGIVNQAIAFEGYPPQSGANGYPPSLRMAPDPHPPTQQQVRVPNVVGQPQEAAFAILTAAGLKATGTPVVHGKVLTVVSQKPTAGATVNKGTTVTLTSKVK